MIGEKRVPADCRQLGSDARCPGGGGCNGEMQPSPSLEISKGKPGMDFSGMSSENESDLPGCGERGEATHWGPFF